MKHSPDKSLRNKIIAARCASLGIAIFGFTQSSSYTMVACATTTFLLGTLVGALKGQIADDLDKVKELRKERAGTAVLASFAGFGSNLLESIAGSYIGGFPLPYQVPTKAIILATSYLAGQASGLNKFVKEMIKDKEKTF